MNPTAAMLVIGDEILSGRTRDSNMHHLATQLVERGIDLKETRVVADETTAIVKALRELSRSFDLVFTSGGIGPTHDDITADCVAQAFNVSIDVREDARAALQAHYDRKGTPMNEARLRMARIPDSAVLIDNPISGAPGFHISNVYVMAGVPRIFEAMLNGVLPTLAGGTPVISATVTVYAGEGDIAKPLADLSKRYPNLDFGSYPFQKEGAFGADLVVRGKDVSELEDAVKQLNVLFGNTHKKRLSGNRV